MLHSRQCSLTSASIWHRAQPQQHLEAHEGGALASEAGDRWESCGFLVSVLFFVANQYLTSLNKRRRLETALEWVFLQYTHLIRVSGEFS